MFITFLCCLITFSQLSGQPSVLYFANRIFEQAGLGFEAALFIGSCMLHVVSRVIFHHSDLFLSGVFKLAMTFVSAFLVENPNFGRRTLLLYGNAGQVTLPLSGEGCNWLSPLQELP
jgi:hypothetical protein